MQKLGKKRLSTLCKVMGKVEPELRFKQRLHFLSNTGMETDAVVTAQAGERVVAWPGP